MPIYSKYFVALPLSAHSRMHAGSRLSSGRTAIEKCKNKPRKEVSEAKGELVV